MSHVNKNSCSTPPSRVNLQFVFILITHLIIEVNAQAGTTSDFSNIFIERCNFYQRENQPRKNCTELFNLFVNSFSNKSICGVERSDYSDFLVAANFTEAIVNKAMFWTKVYPFVYNFTGSSSQSGKYITIVDLLPGYILNNLNWCWSQESHDFNYTYCPSSRECPGGKNAYNSFWNATSTSFASLASGTVFAMINGSVATGAFTNNSQFFTVEVPAMEYPRIKEMHVILVHNPQISFRESCSNFTLKTLNETLNSKGINFSCEEDPSEIRQLQCQLHPEYQSTGYCAVSGQWSLHRYPSSMMRILGMTVAIILKTKTFL